MHAEDPEIRGRGLVILVSAPSGAGKTSLVRELMERDPRVRMGVSHTTRPSRGKECDGRDYYFISSKEFAQMRARGDFLECAEVFGHMYGTSRGMLEELSADNHDVILEIDWQGAAQLQGAGCADASVFILPPNLNSLASRLSGRGSDPQAVIEGRLRAARHEIAQHVNYDYLLVNEDFERAVSALEAIIGAERSRTKRARVASAGLLTELLENGGHSCPSP